jgi:hypothetical protein
MDSIKNRIISCAGRVLGWLLGRESTRFADAVRAELPFSVMEP